MDAPDRALVDAVLANRAGAFEQLVRDYQGLCWHIIQRMVRHPEDTRELCQEAEVKMIACQMTVDLFDMPKAEFIDGVEYAGAAAFFEFAGESDICLYI